MSETQPNRPQPEESQQFMNWDENLPTVTLSNNSANLKATSNETMRNDYEPFAPVPPPQSEFAEYNNNLYQCQQQANIFNQQQNWSQPHSEAEYYNRPLPTIQPEYYNQYYPQQDQQTIIVVPTTQMQDASYVSDDTMKVADDQATNRFGKLSGLVCCKGLLRRSRDAKDENKKKHHCCCCSRKVCLIIIAVILVILAGLAVLLYFLFPSPPAIEVGDPILLPPGLKVNNQSVSAISGSILNEPEFALSMDLATQVTFNSTSFITFGIKNIEVTAGIKNEAGEVIPEFIGNGEVSDLRLPARETTVFTFPFSVRYTIGSATNIMRSPGVQILAANCLANPQRPLTARITVRIDITAISWLGIRPRYSFDRNHGCPSIEQLTQLVRALQG